MRRQRLPKSRVQQIDAATLALDPRPRWVVKAVPCEEGSLSISPEFVAIASLIADIVKPNDQSSCETKVFERTPLFVEGANVRIAVGGKHVDDSQ